jgi:hypothetical protein
MRFIGGEKSDYTQAVFLLEGEKADAVLADISWPPSYYG